MCGLPTNKERKGKEGKRWGWEGKQAQVFTRRTREGEGGGQAHSATNHLVVGRVVYKRLPQERQRIQDEHCAGGSGRMLKIQGEVHLYKIVLVVDVGGVREVHQCGD